MSSIHMYSGSIHPYFDMVRTIFFSLYICIVGVYILLSPYIMVKTMFFPLYIMVLMYTGRLHYGFWVMFVWLYIDGFYIMYSPSIHMYSNTIHYGFPCFSGAPPVKTLDSTKNGEKRRRKSSGQGETERSY